MQIHFYLHFIIFRQNTPKSNASLIVAYVYGLLCVKIRKLFVLIRIYRSREVSIKCFDKKIHSTHSKIALSLQFPSTSIV